MTKSMKSLMMGAALAGFMAGHTAVAQNTNSAASDNHTLGRRIPAAVRGGAAADALSRNTGLLKSVSVELPRLESSPIESMIPELIRVAARDHRAMLREACASAASAFHIPTAINPIPQPASANGTAPIGSSTERGSNSKNEGTAKARVTTDAMANGSKRNANRRSAQRSAECCCPNRHTLRHRHQTATESPP